MTQTIAKIPSDRFPAYCYFALSAANAYKRRIESVVDITVKVSKLSKRGIIVQIWLSPNKNTVATERRLVASTYVGVISKHYVKKAAERLINQFIR